MNLLYTFFNRDYAVPYVHRDRGLGIGLVLPMNMWREESGLLCGCTLFLHGKPVLIYEVGNRYRIRKLGPEILAEQKRRVESTRPRLLLLWTSNNEDDYVFVTTRWKHIGYIPAWIVQEISSITYRPGGGQAPGPLSSKGPAFTTCRASHGGRSAP